MAEDEPSTFRASMRRVPSPVVVVTARGGDEARGITIGSFSSVALDPPLVSFNVGRDSSMFDVMEGCDRFAVHVLGEGQAHLAKQFAIPGLSGPEQFESVPHERDSHGTPILEGGSGVLHCRPHDSVHAGDHSLYVGRVVEVEERPDQGAVLYYKSDYRGVGKALPSTRLAPVKRASNDSS
ncbi:flavin reductase family protein [Salinibacter altiplanensis]|uniref:flavin reductase family protein n=1 Tax=Salinibacter altiplanensis TaxID=1803181 RepID=UPI000C9FC001|nr:flavin reductase family protein [Salinibacter altiplanensis]